MRVAYLTFEFGPLTHGGLGRIVTDLVSHAPSVGVEPVVVLPAPARLFAGRRPERRIEVPGTPYHADFHREGEMEIVALGGGLLDADATYPQPSDLMEAVKSTEMGSLVGVILERLGVDVVHLHDFHGHGVLPLARSLGIPSVYTVHLIHEVTRVLHAFERSACAQADAVTTVSVAYRDENETFFGAARRLEVVPNGYDPSRWSLDGAARAKARRALLERLGLEEGPLLCYVGRIDSWQKGVDLLVEALRSLGRAKPLDFSFVFGGEGWQSVEENIQALCREHPRHVGFVKRFLPEGEVRELFASADFALFPSRFEPFGLVQLEAAAMGAIPCVADTGGLAEVNRDLLPDAPFSTRFARDSSAAVARALREAPGWLRSHAGGAEELRKTLAARLAPYGINAVMRRYHQLYRELKAAAAPAVKHEIVYELRDSK